MCEHACLPFQQLEWLFYLSLKRARKAISLSALSARNIETKAIAANNLLSMSFSLNGAAIDTEIARQISLFRRSFTIAEYEDKNLSSIGIYLKNVRVLPNCSQPTNEITIANNRESTIYER